MNMFALLKSTQLSIPFVLLVGIIKGQSVDFKIQNAALGLIGENVSFPCSAKDKFLQSYGDSGNLAIVWTRGGGQPLVNKHALIDMKGYLEIDNLMPKDNGAYICHVSDKYNTGEVTSIHYLVVFKLPEYYFNITMAFKMIDCNSDSIKHQMGHLLGKICPNVKKPCPFDYSHICKTTIDKQTLKTVHVLDVTVRVVPPRYKLSKEILNCTNNGVYCMKRIAETVQRDMQPLRKLVHEELVRELDAEYNDLAKYDSFDNSTNGANCSAGYKLFEQSICLPCSPGSSSSTTHNQCDVCLENYYQNHYAMASCVLCPDKMITTIVGSKSDEECFGKGRRHDQNLTQGHVNPAFLSKQHKKEMQTTKPSSDMMTSLEKMKVTVEHKSGLSDGAIAAIVVLVLVLLIFLIVLCFVICCCFSCSKPTKNYKAIGKADDGHDTDGQQTRPLPKRTASELSTILEDETVIYDLKTSVYDARNKKVKAEMDAIKAAKKEEYYTQKLEAKKSDRQTDKISGKSPIKRETSNPNMSSVWLEMERNKAASSELYDSQDSDSDEFNLFLPHRPKKKKVPTATLR